MIFVGGLGEDKRTFVQCTTVAPRNKVLPIKWEEASVIDHARRSRELHVKEALHIQMTSGDERFNRDEGLELPKC